jgi:non-ribosomal peptide synthetase component F/acyl carrier protein
VRSLGLTEKDAVAQTASQCFDISVWQFIAPLLVGGRTEIMGDDVAHDPARLLKEVRGRGVTVLEVVPSLLGVLVEAEEGADAGALRWMMPTGEALPVALARRWLARVPQVKMVNAYGPTECSDDVTQQVLRTPPPAEAPRVPIGRPVLNTRVYVLDGRMEPVPVGVVGELYVGGVQVGRGYMGEARKTALAFVPDPFGGEAGARLYRTGDRARWTARGELEYLGREDGQVKVRGFRVELGEIEAALLRHPAVRLAAVDVRKVSGDRTMLLGWVVLTDGATAEPSELRDFIGRYLPEYMVPAVLMEVPALPLTPNGKVDRAALPTPASDEQERRPYEAPRNEMEARVAQTWADVLGLEQVGIHDHFFELGGDSISGIQVLTRLRNAGFQTVPHALYTYPTVAALAESLREESAEEAALVAADVEEATEYPLSSLQAGILFHILMRPEADMYRLQACYTLEGELHLPDFVQAWRDATMRHSTLRSSFHAVGAGGPFQRVHPSAELPVRVMDLRELPEDERAARVDAFLGEDWRQGYDLEKPPLCRLALLRTGDTTHVLVFNMSHLVLDGWSMVPILDEVTARYQAAREGTAYQPDSSPPSFGTFIRWLERQDAGAAEAFWRGRLAGFGEPTPVPEGGSPEDATDDHVERWLHCTPEQTARVHAFAQRHHLTFGTLVRGAWALVLARHSGHSDVMFGGTSAGRSAPLPQVDRMVGVFTTALPVRVKLAADDGLVEWLKRIQWEELESRAYEHVPLSRITGWGEMPRGVALFDTNLVIENLPLHRIREVAGLRISGAQVNERTGYPFTLLAFPHDTVSLLAFYDPSRFSVATVDALMAEAQALLLRFAAEPEARLGALLGDTAIHAPRARAAVAEIPLAPYEPTRTATEAIVARVWADVLGVTRVGRQDSFFELGGESIAAMRVIGRLNHEFRMEFPVRLTFERARLWEFAEALAQAAPNPDQVERIAKLRLQLEAMTPEQLHAALQARRETAPAPGAPAAPLS